MERANAPPSHPLPPLQLARKAEGGSAPYVYSEDVAERLNPDKTSRRWVLPTLVVEVRGLGGNFNT